MAVGRRFAIVGVAALATEIPSALSTAISARRAGAARRTGSTGTSRRAVRTWLSAPGVGASRSGASTCPAGTQSRVVAVAGAVVAALPWCVTWPLDRAVAFLPVAAARPAHRQAARPERPVRDSLTGGPSLPGLGATGLTACPAVVSRVWAAVVSDVPGRRPVTAVVSGTGLCRTTGRSVAESVLPPRVRAVSGLITVARSQPQRLRRKLGWLLPVLPWIWFWVVPDLTWWFRLMPHLARQIGSHRLDLDGLGVHRACQERLALGGALACSVWPVRAARRGRPARRDHRSDRPPDPERVQPLLGLCVAGLGAAIPPPLTGLRVPAIIRAILAGLTLPRLAPALTPPGHD
jgi:hypothetical protein